MALQLALLKSGDEIIADVREVFDKETNKPVSLVFIRPVYVEQTGVTFLAEKDGEESEVTYVFRPWIENSDDEEYFVPHDWVVTVCKPTITIIENYIRNIGVRVSDSESATAEDGAVPDLGD